MTRGGANGTDQIIIHDMFIVKIVIEVNFIPHQMSESFVEMTFFCTLEISSKRSNICSNICSKVLE